MDHSHRPISMGKGFAPFECPRALVPFAATIQRMLSCGLPEYEYPGKMRSRSLYLASKLSLLLLLLLGIALNSPFSAQADGVCDVTLFGKLYEVFYIPSSGGIAPRFNAISEAIESDSIFGKRINVAVVGTVGGGTAGSYSKYGGLNVSDPNANSATATSESEDISANGNYIIGWRQEFPLVKNPPRAFLISTNGFKFLDELFPAVKELSERVWPPGAPPPGTPGGGSRYGTLGKKVNNSGLMIIQSVPDANSGSTYYLVTNEGKVSPIDPNRGLDLDEFGQAPLPSQLVEFEGQRGLITDVNKNAYVGLRPGIIDWPGGRIDLRAEISAQCNNPVIQKELSDPTGSRPVYINDANHISYGNLLLMPACPNIEFSVQGTSGFVLINGKISIRVGTRFKVRTSIRNLERGSLEKIGITPNGISPFFKMVSPPNPPIPDRIGPNESLVSFSEWEVLVPGQYVGNWTLNADGSCGPVKEETPVLTVEVLPALEKRIVVNSTADRGKKAGVDCCDTGEHLPNGDPECTLRAAIEAVSAGCGNLVEFNIPGDAVPRIAPASRLPSITKPSVLDGKTQSGGFVELDGTAVLNGPGLEITGGNTVIRGFVIHGFQGDQGMGILMKGFSGNVISGNRLGTDATGNTERRNTVAIGIDQSSLNRIGGSSSADANIIGGDGIAIKDGEANRIVGNRIGIGVNGSALTEGKFGVLLLGGRGTIVGGAGTEGNLISSAFGVAFNPSASIDDTVIDSNRIGLQEDGTSVGKAASHPRIGIAVLGRSSGVIRNTTIQNNEIAGHRVDLFIARSSVTGVVVRKNKMGMTFAGGTGLPTGIASEDLEYGLRVDGAENVLITGNVIAGHQWDVLNSGSEQFEVDPNDGEIFLHDPEHALEVNSMDLAPGPVRIEQNTIGLNTSGNVPVGTKSHSGLVVFGGAVGTVIRDNVVAGHAENEVWLIDGGQHVVAGNRLGTPDGIDRGSKTGLLLDDPKSVLVGPSGVSPGNTIGWNAVSGIHLRGAPIDPVIRLNQIGTDPTGLAAWPNGTGIQAGTVDVRGDSVGLRIENNIIAGNTKVGVAILLTNETVLQGNRIGTSPINTPVPNQTGVIVGNAPVRLLQNTIAHNQTAGVSIVGKQPALIQGGPIYANGTGLGIEGIFYDSAPFVPPAAPVILRSRPNDQGKVTVVYLVTALGGTGEAEVEIYGNRTAENQGRTPLLRRKTPAGDPLLGKIEVEATSAFAVLDSFTATFTRDGQTSEFSEASPGLSFELSRPKLTSTSDTELTMQWSGSPFIVPEQANSPDGPWEEVTAKPVISSDGTAVLTLPVEAGTKFFRLRLNL